MDSYRKRGLRIGPVTGVALGCVLVVSCGQSKEKTNSQSSAVEANATQKVEALPTKPTRKGNEVKEEKGHARKSLPSPEELAKLPPDGGPEYNRLVFEHSPYLLQHAGNPVDWHPWGKEAFEKARKEDKPVFLSVGYTTCHWCHVMEHESFEDDEVAALMNKWFVCVKVDREERPDVDNVYMTVTQMMTGSGGWPMTVVLTPDKKPFFAGTYIPKQSRFGRTGMMDLLPQLHNAWKNQRPQIGEVTKAIVKDLAQASGVHPGDSLDESVFRAAFVGFRRSYDSVHGGFGNRPKFPTAHNLCFLLRHHARFQEEQALAMVENTLTKIRLGGVYDQVGLGIHRYSTDERWFLPHFEKMLYDQALFVIANLECHQVTGNESYAQVAREALTYVLRDMTDPDGGFYSAEDADSEGEEGKFYLWTKEEVTKILGKEKAERFMKVYNFTDEGTFIEEATRERTGANVPFLQVPLEIVARQLDLPEKTLREELETSRKALFEVREKRVHPQKDDKILTDWNGLMISAFAQAAQVLDEPAYLEAAQNAADYCLSTLRRKDGRLLKRSRRGNAGLPAHLEDYSFLIHGLVDLYQASFETRYLKEALALTDLTLKHFWDKEGAGFFLTADDGEKLLVRAMESYDGAMPSGNSIMALNLVRLARATGRTAYEEKAQALVQAFAGA
ncbi:MAG: thioredoxin domain-containing protein, partial [Opitutales bacterium]